MGLAMSECFVEHLNHPNNPVYLRAIMTMTASGEASERLSTINYIFAETSSVFQPKLVGGRMAPSRFKRLCHMAV